jgi:hypothetical protein
MEKINDLPINFMGDLSIGYLNVETMDFTWLNHINGNNTIYNHIQSPFSWYYHGDIMIIPDPIPSPRDNWNKILSIGPQHIECPGYYALFFHFQEITNKCNLATSLTLPEFEHINNELTIF